MRKLGKSIGGELIVRSSDGRILNPKSSTELEIFVSHSSKDKKIADALIDLLKNALRLSNPSILCTSVPGHKLKAGAHTETELRAKVRSAVVLIGIITEFSLDSAFVLIELGARWGAERPLFPLTANGITPEQLPEPLKSTNALDGASQDDVQQLVDDVAHRLGIKPEPASAYSKYVTKLVNACRRKQSSSKPQNAFSPPKTFSAHDASLLDSFQKLFPADSPTLRFLREHDIGVQFHYNRLTPLREFVETWNVAEREFDDAELENCRRNLYDLTERFSAEVAMHTYPSSTLKDHYTMGLKDWEDRPEIKKVQKELNALGTKVYETEQQLIRLARRKRNQSPG